MNLIGKRVLHKDSRSIGEIIEIKNGIMKVSYHEDVHLYKFPDAFDSALELEDEELQSVLESEGSYASFEEFKKQYSTALYREIEFLREQGGKRYRAIDGVCIDKKSGTFLYAFDTDTELHLPDGTPIRILSEEGVLYGTIIACEEFNIYLSTKTFLGEKCSSIEFTADQWFLLEILKEKIDELTVENNSIAYKLACKGMSKVNPQSGIMMGQNYALKKALSDDITFIWGPPGTGKTQTLAKIALEAMESGKRVLMVSYSNVSVDGALLRVAGMSEKKPGEVLRFGYPRKIELIEHPYLTSYQYVLKKFPHLAEEYRTLQKEKKGFSKKSKEYAEINERIREIRKCLLNYEKDAVYGAKFVATTISKAVADKAIASQTFDVVIFDEASMAYVPQIVYAGTLAKSHFICLGDFRQLPAIVQNPSEHKLTKDIFYYSSIEKAVENDYGHEWLVMLNEQYRMHQDISDHVGNNMYGGMLRTSEKIAQYRAEIANCEPLPGKAMGMLDLSFMYSACIKTMDGSHLNLLSALLSTAMAEIFAEKYEVAIVTPYNAQSRLILAMLRDAQERNGNFKRISTATVHQFQGSEKPIVIYDVVDCFRQPYPGALLTMTKNNTANRLFNVALTRAQGKFLLVANRDYLVRKKISPKLFFTQTFKRICNSNSMLAGEQILSYMKNGDSKRLFLVNDRDESWTLFIEDLKKVKKSVWIEFPGPMEDENEKIIELCAILKELQERNVAIRIRGDAETSFPNQMEPFIKEKSPFIVNPVTIIDEKIIWFGHPIAEPDFITEGQVLYTEYFPTVRFKGKNTATALQAFL